MHNSGPVSGYLGSMLRHLDRHFDDMVGYLEDLCRHLGASGTMAGYFEDLCGHFEDVSSYVGTHSSMYIHIYIYKSSLLQRNIHEATFLGPTLRFSLCPQKSPKRLILSVRKKQFGVNKAVMCPKITDITIP